MSRDYKPSAHLVGATPAPEVSARTAFFSAVLFIVLMIALSAVCPNEPAAECAAQQHGASKK